MMSRHGTSVLAAVAMLLFGCGAAAAADLPGKGVTVRPVQGTDIESQFQIEVVDIGLRHLGYTVAALKQLSPALYYSALASGDADFGVETWWPNHKSLYEHGGGAAKLTLLGTVVAGATQGYFIDKKTADQYNITNIAQLKDAKLAALFAADAEGKARLNGCPPGWACEGTIDYQLKAYGLLDTVTHVKGDNSVLKADLVSEYKSGKPILYYTYTPLWLDELLVPGKDVVALEVPFTALPGGTVEGSVNTSLPDGRNAGWPLSDIKAIGNNAFLAKNPVVKLWLESIAIPVADVNYENFLIYKGEKSSNDIRRHAEAWVQKNQAYFDAQIAKVLAASAAD